MAAQVPDAQSVYIAGIAARIFSNFINNQLRPPLDANEKNRRASLVVSTSKDSERRRLTAGASNINESIKDGLRAARIVLPPNDRIDTLARGCNIAYTADAGDLEAKRAAATTSGVNFLIPEAGPRTAAERQNFIRNIIAQEEEEQLNVAATRVQAVVRGRQQQISRNLPKNINDPLDPALNPVNIPLWNPEQHPEVPEAETADNEQLQYFQTLNAIDVLNDSQTNLPNPINYEEFEIMNELNRLNRSINVARQQEVIFTNKILKELEETYNQFIQALDMCRTPQELAQAALEGGMAKLNPALYRHLLHTIRTQITANRNVGKNIDMRRIKSKIRAILESHRTHLRSTIAAADRRSSRPPLGVAVDFPQIQEAAPAPRLTGGWKYISKKRTRKFKKTKRRTKSRR